MGAHGASDRLRVLVVGLGSMGNRRLRNLAHLGEPDVAAFEPDPERRQQAEQRGVPVFETFERALEWGPDALVISTPPDRHHEYAMAAAAHGLHFFTEASVVPGRTQELIEAVGDQAIVAAPSCTLRFHPGIQLLARRLEAGAVGRPLAVVHHVGQHLADWHPWEDYRHFYAGRRDTGAARELVVYELNWMTQLFGPIRQVQGIARKVSALELEIDDLYAAIIGFGSGVEGTLVVEVISRPAVRAARVVGEAGTLVWDFGARSISEWSAEAGEWKEYPDPPAVDGPGGTWVAESMYIDEMAAFLRAIREGGDDFPNSLREDEHLLTAVTALERSSAEGCRIELG